MADTASAPKPVVTKTDDGYTQASWATGALGGVATGTKASLGDLVDPYVQIVGTWGSATGVLEGSLDGTTWFALYSKQQIATAGKNDTISFTADGAMSLLSLPRYIRFKTTGGTSSNLTCYVTGKRR